MRDNKILEEFYSNGFNLGDASLLQTAPKTYAGAITHGLIDHGDLDSGKEIGLQAGERHGHVAAIRHRRARVRAGGGVELLRQERRRPRIVG